MSDRSLTAAVARRFLVIRHFLAPSRSLPVAEESVLAVVDRLGSLQFDPLEVAGRNHDLVLHARVPGYRRPWTDRLLYDRRLLFEAYNKGLSILPTRELPWHRLTWDRARRAHEGEILRDHGDHVAELLDRIRRDGPISTADLERSEVIDWYWGPTLKSRAVLEALAEAGILGIARREGNRRHYDLAERLFPAGLLAERVPEREQLLHRLLSRYRAHGLLGATGQAEIFYGFGAGEPLADGSPRPRRAALLAELVMRGELVPFTIEGIRGVHHVVTDELPLLAQAEREVAAGHPPGGAPPSVTFLAPLDSLAWDRNLLRSLFG
ncbi:MAG TPA: crosslink repair DNA glycosylase YcaQ family protein, partial [Candidatus Nanopelagicales bacterium]|nr:crosslink repair DNA glycosylase YcaQ family protein [Candidatus Nanopelagicales bacterium]